MAPKRVAFARSPALCSLVLAAVLGGCVGPSDDGTSTNQGGAGEMLADGTGAIAGLLVDDRFRPIALPQGQGFVLLQELGRQAQTTANGEFVFTGLEPGTYTLRVQSPAHELPATRVHVRGNEWTEATLVARRVADDSGSTLSTEYTFFFGCYVTFGVGNQQCMVDRSGDTTREFFKNDYTALGDRATAMVIEAAATSDQPFDFWVSGFDAANGTEGYAHHYGPVDGLRYVLWRQDPGDPDPVILDGGSHPWTNALPVVVFIRAPGETAYTLDDWLEQYDRIGIILGQKGTVLETLFVGEPDVDVESFCALCG